MSLLPCLLALVLLAPSAPSSSPRHELERAPSPAESAGLDAALALAPEALAPVEPLSPSSARAEPGFERSMTGTSSSFPLGWTLLGLWFGGSLCLVTLWALAGRLVGRHQG